MTIIGWKQLKEMQPYSRQHISRLEQAGKFPKRVRIGNNRIGWVLAEVEEHFQRLADARSSDDGS